MLHMGTPKTHLYVDTQKLVGNSATKQTALNVKHVQLSSPLFSSLQSRALFITLAARLIWSFLDSYIWITHWGEVIPPSRRCSRAPLWWKWKRCLSLNLRVYQQLEGVVSFNRMCAAPNAKENITGLPVCDFKAANAVPNRLPSVLRDVSQYLYVLSGEKGGV